MKIIKQSDQDFRKQLEPLMNRTAFDVDIERSVATILADIKCDGDNALIKYAKKFDGADLTPETFLVTEAEIDTASEQIEEKTKDAIDLAIKHVQEFSAKKIPQNWNHSPRDGVTMGEQYAPLSKVGCYIPGGTAPLISTIIHTAAIANTAGVTEIVIVTPPGKDGIIHPAMLYAARQSGVTAIYRLGGVYAIGALAYGTETITKVEKIVGPGNAYVTAAKRQVYGYTALDLVAGPSEIMIIADETAPANFVAADILSQAEHGSGHEQAVLATTDSKLIPKVIEELKKQSLLLKRRKTIEKVLDNGVFLILVENLNEACKIANLYAPEHLEIMARDAEELATKIETAGAIFLGAWTPEPLGDFVAGASHVLPTGGAGRFFSGLTVEQFFRRMSVVKYDKKALLKELPAIEEFARQEGLDAHGRSATIRRDEG